MIHEIVMIDYDLEGRVFLVCFNTFRLCTYWFEVINLTAVN